MKPLLTFTLTLFLCTSGLAQGFIEKVTDLLEFNLGKPPADSNAFHSKIVLAPIAYYEPQTNFGFGVGSKLLFKFKRAQEQTRTSNLPAAISYTLNGQFFFESSYTVFFPEEKYLLRGNLDFSNFPQGYYGIGNGTTEDDRTDIAFKQFLFEPLLLRKVYDKLFLGGGIRYNRIFDTVLEEDTELLPGGFNLQDSLGSTSAGLEFAATWDSRDNVLNAQRGLLVEFTQGFYGTSFGGTNSFELTKLDVRRYQRLSDRSTLAYNAFGRHTWNDAPAQELSTLGGPTLLRGFQEGRFRDRVAFFSQLEYRYQGRGRLGFVAFAGAGQVADRVNDFTIGDFRYSVGGGLRIMIVPSERLNLRFDYAAGLGPSADRNFYLGIAEAF